MPSIYYRAFLSYFYSLALRILLYYSKYYRTRLSLSKLYICLANILGPLGLSIYTILVAKLISISSVSNLGLLVYTYLFNIEVEGSNYIALPILEETL